MVAPGASVGVGSYESSTEKVGMGAWDGSCLVQRVACVEEDDLDPRLVTNTATWLHALTGHTNTATWLHGSSQSLQVCRFASSKYVKYGKCVKCVKCVTYVKSVKHARTS